MKKFKKMMVGLVLAVTLLGNCISVYAAADGVCDSCNKAMTLYEKQYLYKEFWETHTEQHGAITVVCEDVNPETDLVNIGDIVICLERAKEQAKEYGHSLKRELAFLSLHGLLHLLGYDHIEPEDEKQMIALQKEILDQAGITR